MRFILACVFVGISATASAQSGALAKVWLTAGRVGITTPMPTISIPFSPALCDQPAPTPPPAIVINPTRLGVRDPLQPTVVRYCIFDVAAFVASLPLSPTTTTTADWKISVAYEDDFGQRGTGIDTNPFRRNPPSVPVPTGAVVW